ncbi:MAG TPA: type II toxin-antitoxin system HicA family toxin [Candidatus Kapabacteria bacterium]|nr:type II toxin-antitoxin system HicA family toxin [Candidatus Kapabacteria bacterium]
MNPPNGKEFCKTLEQNGWTLRRVEGSHFIYGKEKSPVRISVPVHGNRALKFGLWKHLEKLAGI